MQFEPRERGGLTLGHVEAKEVEAGLGREERGEQVGRYLAALPNLLLTDYVEFRWFVDGKKRETFRLANAVSGGRLTRVSEEDLERARRVLIGFLSQPPAKIGSAEELARRLAGLAHLIRDGIARAFKTGQGVPSQPAQDSRILDETHRLMV